MRRLNVTVEAPSPSDLQVLAERAKALAREDAEAQAQATGELFVSFASAGLKLAVAEPRVLRMVPRVGTLHSVPGSRVHLSWIDMRPLVVVDLASAFGDRREVEALSQAPGLILRASPSVVVALSGPLDLVEDALSRDAGHGAWPHDRSALRGTLGGGSYLLSEQWLEQWVAARATEEA